MHYQILRNNRAGTGYKDPTLCCCHCGTVTTRYLKIDNWDKVTDRINPIILCRTCLTNFDKEMRKSLLEEVNVNTIK